MRPNLSTDLCPRNDAVGDRWADHWQPQLAQGGPAVTEGLGPPDQEGSGAQAET